MNWKKALSFEVSEPLLLLFILAFLLRLPTLFEPYWYGDEGIYLTLGLAIRKGLTLYRDIHDNKPPLLYLIAALSGNQFWFRSILLFWNLINVWLIYELGKLIFKRQLPAAVAGFLFILFSLLPEGNIANGEVFMIMPVTAGMLILCKVLNVKTQFRRGLGAKLKAYFLSGVLFSLGFLFKAPAIFSFLAALIFLAFFSKQKKSSLLNTQFFILIAGFCFLPLLSFIFYWSHGALFQYWTAAFTQNAGYVSSWGGKWGSSLFSLSSGFTQRGLILTSLILILFFLRRRLSWEFLLVSLWFFIDLFASLLSARPYPHYLIQVAPALALLATFVIGRRKILEKILASAAIFLLIFSFIFYKFWRYPVWTYYANFFRFAAGRESKEQYFAFFDKRVNNTYKLAGIVKKLTNQNDNIFVWGNEPYLYALSERLPPGRYMVAYHIIDFNGWQETTQAIKKKRPTLIIRMKGEKQFSQLNQILSQEYLAVLELDGAKIFKRIDLK